MISIREQNGITVVTVDWPELKELDGIDLLGEALYEIRDKRGARFIIVDLRNVRHLSGNAIGKFLQLNKRALALEASVILCNIHTDLTECFNLTGLDQVFKIQKDLEQALDLMGIVTS